MMVFTARRRWALAMATGTALTTLLSPSISRAADKVEKKECVAAYEEGQRSRKEGKLSEARERLLVCAQDGCPAVVRRDCTQWVGESELSTPAVVLEAVGDGGRDLTEVRVSVDGKPVAVDGKAVSLNSGPHVVQF